MSAFLSLLGLGAFGVSVWGLVFGGVRWARIKGRKESLGLALGSLLVFIVGVVTAPAPTTPAVFASVAQPAATITVTAAPVTVTATAVPLTATPTPEPTPTPVVDTTESSGSAALGVTSESGTATKQPSAPKQTSATKNTGTTTKKAGIPVYYKNCTAARAAGATPIYRGQPGYASHLDRDNDGKACE